MKVRSILRSVPRGRGFTLIELLIVVAIIAILAAIAMPNFLEAQVRSKVARVQGDMRNMSVALESYCVDFNNYPPRPATQSDRIWQGCLTTPMGYLSAACQDVFTDPLDLANLHYQYSMCPMMKSYLFLSVGPDRVDTYDESRWMCGMAMTYPMPYDPTNGTRSVGDIPRVNRQGGAPLVPPSMGTTMPPSM